MQYIKGFNARRSVHAYVQNDREILIFIKSFLVQEGALDCCENYMPLLDRISEQVETVFSPYLHVVAIDLHTRKRADENSDFMALLVEPKQKIVRQ